MIRIFIITLLCLGPNLFWGPNLYGQELKVTYQANAKHVNNSNPKTDRVLGQIASSINSVLPRINFVAETNNKYNRFYYETSMTTDLEGENLFDLAISIALDGKQIFGDYGNKIAYYEPTMVNKIRSVQMNNIKWSITKVSKNILGFKCFKATGKIIDLNAEYKLTPPTTAWFCPELGLNGGPTAYATLPGMILELENHKMKFTAKKIEQKENINLKYPNYKPENVLSHKDWTAYFETNNTLPALRN